eukprot:TRINITY_DN93273_c0_g1_i1.p1 TRINITY_DN93273_c0_g1~~TRINITY_DN93273_c0_g1_i1.p1  ORF type:complete len:424 (-),score=66.40 TRINITY_DN93273_c0_g1_i1:15-1286(-)
MLMLRSLLPKTLGLPRSRCLSTLVKLRPPGNGASQEKIARFRLHLDRTLERGQTVELPSWGPAALCHALQALSTATKSVEFEVHWSGLGRAAGDHRSLRFVASSGKPWEDYLKGRLMNTQGLFVQPTTKAVQLTRAIAKALQAAPADAAAIRVNTFMDDAASVSVLVKALASAPTVYPYHKLRCVANIVRPMEDPRSRVIVYVQGEATERPPDPTGAVFQAMPPGANAESPSLQRFYASVQDRLHRGDQVTIECRGPDAVLQAVRSLCLLQGHVAKFTVSWTSPGESQDKGGAKQQTSQTSQTSLNVLRMQAERGQTWESFNSTDFRSTHRLLATPGSPVEKLAWAAIAEVRKEGAVSLHCYSDNKDSVNTLLKAIATVPRLTGGQSLVCTPSFGRSGPGKNPVLRVFVQRKRVDSRSDRTSE